ncbi:MAG: SRPBCC family protein [Metallosphaera sp.]|uniref:Coenzyme Q-binding protein COQ10 START domain-containing protein n=1 Tax=Metallosphaera cuprina (strain Ar-4) TaxID=1006006 RepID=F4G2A6_METCR|nr:hypothetical protein [Metallosphaera cuprina]AEB94954.1 conserved hypothetical protein [Metallosphaera cuprina Ar-4]
MIKFSITKGFQPEIHDLVLDIVKDVNSMPKYWKGIRELNLTKVSDNLYEGKIRFAFPSTSTVRIEVNDDSVKLRFLRGILQGQNEIRVLKDKVTSTWEVKMPFYMRPFDGRNKEHFEQGTTHALERIIEEAKVRLTSKG